MNVKSIECWTVIPTPLGLMHARSLGDALAELRFLAGEPVDGGFHGARNDALSLFTRLRRELGEYFAGSRTGFGIPTAPGGTSFQRVVWNALVAIPCGRTESYAQLARRIGKPEAVRAVGGANARNPIAILVPCHRVIGADGTLTGYAGGLARKRALLALESPAGAGLPRRGRACVAGLALPTGVDIVSRGSLPGGC